MADYSAHQMVSGLVPSGGDSPNESFGPSAEVSAEVAAAVAASTSEAAEAVPVNTPNMSDAGTHSAASGVLIP